MKTAAYVGGLGRKGLHDVLHPPLDNGLKNGLKKHFKACSACRAEVNFGWIKDITDYDRYRRVIAGCRTAAFCLGCSLIEVDQLARLGLCKGEKPPGELVSKLCLLSPIMLLERLARVTVLRSVLSEVFDKAGYRLEFDTAEGQTWRYAAKPEPPPAPVQTPQPASITGP